MANKRTIYNGTFGQSNRVASERRQQDVKSGFVALDWSKNVTIDQSGALEALRGTELVAAGNWHSMTIGQDGQTETAYVVKEGANTASVVRLDADNGAVIQTTVLEGLTANRRMSWAWAPAPGGYQLFFTNGINYGWVEKSNSFLNNWPLTENNPDPDANDGYVQLRDFFKKVPPQKVGWNGYRLVFSFNDCGNHCVGFTMHGAYGLWRRTDWLQFPDRVIEYVPVADGHYIGTEIAIYFVTGLSVTSESMVTQMAGFPLIEHGVLSKLVDPYDFGIESSVPCRVAATRVGPCLLMAGGNIVPLIKKSMKLPIIDKAGIGVFDETTIFQTYN